MREGLGPGLVARDNRLVTTTDAMLRTRALRRLLEDHSPSDDTERGYAARTLSLLDHGDRALSRDFFTPGHVTASAFVLSPKRDALLLILHEKLGLWLQPGGHVEPSDASVEEAARREAAEEVGLTTLELAHPGIFDVDVHDIPARPGQPEHRHFDVRFLFVSPTHAVRPASDAIDARWAPLDAVDLIHSDDSVMRAVRRLSAG